MDDDKVIGYWHSGFNKACIYTRGFLFKKNANEGDCFWDPNAEPYKIEVVVPDGNYKIFTNFDELL